MAEECESLEKILEDHLPADKLAEARRIIYGQDGSKSKFVELLFDYFNLKYNFLFILLYCFVINNIIEYCSRTVQLRSCHSSWQHEHRTGTLSWPLLYSLTLQNFKFTLHFSIALPLFHFPSIIYFQDVTNVGEWSVNSSLQVQ